VESAPSPIATIPLAPGDPRLEPVAGGSGPVPLSERQALQEHFEQCTQSIRLGGADRRHAA
jgi:hypothetical protein